MNRVCKICGGNTISVDYEGKIRNGGLGKFTENSVIMWRCNDCNTIWHDAILHNASYYESTEYREALEGTTSEDDFYRLHDKDSLDKFTYTGTTIFRNKRVADIGCGCGAFLDYISGVAEEVVAIEPSKIYRDIMNKKGFRTYGYASEALQKYEGKIDVLTSFDVIEHVEDPQKFVEECYQLLAIGGVGIIGTPTEAPVMREFLVEIYEKNLLFSTQHLWVLSESSLSILAQKSKCSDYDIKYFQRYGMDNFLGWLRDKKPNSGIVSESITPAMNEIWKRELEKTGKSDYIVLYLRKGN